MTRTLPPTKERGRPRAFDRDKALEIAMRMFWRHGYEGTSIAELAKAVGINHPSLYAAFGSKESLFREAVEQYATRVAAPAFQTLWEISDTREAVAAFLRALARQFTHGPATRRGCMIAGGELACASEHSRVAREMTSRRRLAQEEIRKRLMGTTHGPASFDNEEATSMAAYIATVIQGMAVQARDGASTDRLIEVANYAMRSWPTSRPTRKRRSLK